MKKANILRVILILNIIIILFGFHRVFAIDLEKELEVVEYSESYEKWQELSNEDKIDSIVPRKYDIKRVNNKVRSSTITGSLLSSKLLLSGYTKYDLRDYNIHVEVKDQMTTNQCWAFAANSVIETNVEKITGNVSPIYSTRYLEYATSKTFLDGINKNSYNREINYGGNAQIAMGFYTSGKGPILEEDFPFSTSTQKMYLSDIDINKFEVQKQIKCYELFDGIYKTYKGGIITYTDADGEQYTTTEVNNIRNRIKEHIINYGAVVSQTYGIGNNTKPANIYYNNPNNVNASNAYFCDDNTVIADHQITIIGWDDNYLVTNFNTNHRPSTPGAYIVLNSWGEEFGDNGVYYISYEDALIERDILGVVLTTDVDYDKVYQYDELGNNKMLVAKQDVYGANIFNRDEEFENEYLTQIGIGNLVSENCDIYVNSINGDLNLNNFTKVASNVELKSGYYTLKLENPIKLIGDKFIIIVKHKVDATGTAYFGLESPDGFLWNNATANFGESYVSFDGYEWDDVNKMGVVSNSNLCMKAFTEYKEENVIDPNPDPDPTPSPTPDSTSTPSQNPTTEPSFIINKYKQSEDTIYSIPPNTKFREFANNISTNMEYYIYNFKNEIIGKDDIIATGMKLEVNNKLYKLVVLGDLDGNGKITITDTVKARLHLVKIAELADEFEKAADVNGDGRITITDIVILNLVNVNLRNL